MNKLSIILLLAACFLGQTKTACSQDQTKKIVLTSSDEKKFTIDDEIAKKSGTLRNMLEDWKDLPDKDTPIPLPGINTDTLEAIINCLQDPENIGPVITSLTGPRLRSFIGAVNYLDIPEIFEQIPAIPWLKELLLSTAQKGPVLHHNKQIISSIAISPDSSFIVTGSWDKTVRMWNKDGQLVTTLPDHKDTVESIAISSDSSFIVTGSYDGTVYIWNRKGKRLAVLSGHTKCVYSIAISPDNSFFVTISDDKTVRIWHRDGQQLAVLNHDESVISVAISHDSLFIVTGSFDGTVRIWNKNGQQLVELHEHKQPVYSIAISPDDSFIVTGSGEGTILIWNRDGQQLAVLNHEKPVCSIAISPDNSFFVTGSDDGTVHIWNKNGQQLAVSKHDKPVGSIAISSDSSFFVTVSYDDTVRIWNRVGQQLTILHGELVNSVKISPDNSFFVTGSGFQSTVMKSGLNAALIWNTNHPNIVYNLHPDQIYLITKIYEQVNNGLKLNLPKDSPDKKVFKTLPQAIQKLFRNKKMVSEEGLLQEAKECINKFLWL